LLTKSSFLRDEFFRVSALVLKYAPDGQLLWSRTWHNGDHASGEDDAFDVAAHPFGGAVISGASHALGQPQNQLVARFNASGTLLWSTLWANDLNRDVDGGSVIEGDLAALTFDGGSVDLGIAR
jgi:hypothetical protein